MSPGISCSARTLFAPVRRFTQARSAACVQQPRGTNPLAWLQLADAAYRMLLGAVSSARSVNQACFQLDASASRTAESCLSRQLRQAVAMPLSLEEWHKHSTLPRSQDNEQNASGTSHPAERNTFQRQLSAACKLAFFPLGS